MPASGRPSSRCVAGIRRARAPTAETAPRAARRRCSRAGPSRPSLPARPSRTASPRSPDPNSPGLPGSLSKRTWPSGWRGVGLPASAAEADAAESGTAVAAGQAPRRGAVPQSAMTHTCLLARHLERVIDAGLLPGAGQRAVVRADVVELRIDHDRLHRRGSALRCARSSRSARARRPRTSPTFGPGLIMPLTFLPSHFMTMTTALLAPVRPPFAAPGAVERKSLLGLNGHGEQ